MKQFLLGGILGSCLLFLYLSIFPDYLNYESAENFQEDFRDTLVSGDPLPQMWIEYLEQAQTICFLSYYQTTKDVDRTILLSADARAILENKLSIPYGFSETVWWIIGVNDYQIQYMLKMNRGMSPNINSVICGDSKKLVLQAIPDQPFFFNVRFDL